MVIKKKKKKTKRKGVQKLSKEAWALMSKWVRLRDKNICYTCNRVASKPQAGHFAHSPKTNPASYLEYNIHCQCDVCNKWKNGSPDIYAANIIRDYGPDTLEEIVRVKKAGTKMSVSDYESIISDLKEKITELEDN